MRSILEMIRLWFSNSTGVLKISIAATLCEDGIGKGVTSKIHTVNKTFFDNKLNF